MDQYYNNSTGEGDHGEIDARGPWNQGEPLKYVEAPAFQDVKATVIWRPPSTRRVLTSPNRALQELLADQLRDILHAEKQLLKALPKMAKAARSTQLQRLFAQHLEETEAQVERLNDCLRPARRAYRAKPCKGMAGLVEEGEEVISEGKKKDDAPADLALIGAAQRVEHYEIAAYTTARNLALQLRHRRDRANPHTCLSARSRTQDSS